MSTRAKVFACSDDPGLVECWPFRDELVGDVFSKDRLEVLVNLAHRNDVKT